MESATATKPVTFTSPYPNLHLTRISEEKVRAEGGRVIGRIAPGSRLNERYGIEDDGSPWAIDFEGGVFKTDDQILIDWLRGHKPFDPSDGSGDREVESGGYGIDYHEMDAPLEEPKPTVAEQAVRIAQAQGRLDVADLTALLDEERNTHSREAVIQGAEAALQAIAEGTPEQGAGADNPGNGNPPSTSAP